MPGLADAEHIVEPGDTLSGIAHKHGSTVSELVAANELADPDLIRAGEVLRIPQPGGENPIIYVVERGDTLAQIATAHGTTTAALAEANGILDVNRIYSGMTLEVVGGDASAGGGTATGGGTVVETSAPAPVVTGGTTTYTVVPGDTLSKIAARFDVTGAQLLALNDLADPDLLRSGQTLIVPGAGFTCPISGSWYTNDWHAPRSGGRVHLGTDLFAAEGTAVVAPVSGTVQQITGTVGGLQFWLTGDDGNLYIGTHMASFGLDGRVEAGDLIGTVGHTGNAKSTPPHLHFEIITGGDEINPYTTLQANGC